jgi:tetratricopeptide (TPR) repeat protein
MFETMFERRSAAEEHYQRGLQLKRKGYLLEAEHEFRLSLETDPAYFDPLLELLVEQEETGISEDIRSDQLLRRADQKYKLGMALLKHNRPERAIRHLEAACELENDNARYLCGLGEALAAFSRKAEAKEKLRLATTVSGGSEPRKYNARANYLLGKMHFKQGHINRARRRLLMAYSLDSNSAEISSLLKRAKVGPLTKWFALPRIRKEEKKVRR